MKCGELWGNLRSIIQFYLDKTTPSPDRTGRAPLKEQHGGAQSGAAHGPTAVSDICRDSLPGLWGGPGCALLHLWKCHLGM